MYASSASFTSGMRWTRPSRKVGSCSSAFRLCGANFSSAIASAVSIAASIVSRECCANRGRSRSDSTSSTSKSWNSRSRRLTIREPMVPPSRPRRCCLVEQRLHLERDVVGAALLRAGRIAVDDPLVLEGEVHEVERTHVVFHATRDPRLVARDLQRGDVIVADLALLELAKDGETRTVIVVPRLREVVGLLEDARVGPRVRGRAGSGVLPEAAVVVAELHQADDLVAALGIGRAAQRIVEEDGAADAVVRVLVRARRLVRGPTRNGQARSVLAEDLIVEVTHDADDLLRAIVMAAVDVPGLRVPEVGRHHGDEPGSVVARGLGSDARLPAALEDAEAVLDMVLCEEAVGLEAEVAQDEAVELSDGRLGDVGYVDAHVRRRRLQAIAAQRQQDAAAAQPEPVGELDLPIGIEDLGRSAGLGAGSLVAGGRRVDPAEVPGLEQDVEVDVLDHRSGGEETAAAAVEVHGIGAVGSVRLDDPVLRDPVPGLDLGSEAEPGVLAELDLTRRTEDREGRDR